MSAAEGFSALSPLPVSGGRRHSAKKLKLVKKKTVRKMLKKMGMKMRGGAPAAAAGTGSVALEAPVADAVKEAAMGGRRKTRGNKSRRSKRFLGMF
jgi:hypothetical protein